MSSKDPKLVADWAGMYSKSLSKVKGLTVGEAVPCALEKAEGRYRWQIVVRSASAGAAVRSWKWLVGVRPPPPALRVAIDVDAISLV